jgi:hypothetical protein
MPVGILVVLLQVAEIKLADETNRLDIVGEDFDSLLLQAGLTRRSRFIVGHDSTPPVLPLSMVSAMAVRLTD